MRKLEGSGAGAATLFSRALARQHCSRGEKSGGSSPLSRALGMPATNSGALRMPAPNSKTLKVPVGLGEQPGL